MSSAMKPLATFVGLALGYVASFASAGIVPPFGQELTYQGELAFGGVPVTDTCDFRIDVWDAAVGGSEVDGLTDMGVQVLDGRFTTRVRCGDEDCYSGDPRWLEIEVRCPAGAGGFTTLTPRQEVTPAPYSVMAAEVPQGSITSSEIADGTIVPADVAGGLYSSKLQLYQRTETRQISVIGTHLLEAFCADSDDLAVSGSCGSDASGASQVYVGTERHLNWTDESAAAGVECIFYNSIAAASDLFAEILCLSVP